MWPWPRSRVTLPEARQRGSGSRVDYGTGLIGTAPVGSGAVKADSRNPVAGAPADEVDLGGWSSLRQRVLRTTPAAGGAPPPLGLWLAADLRADAESVRAAIAQLSLAEGGRCAEPGGRQTLC